MIAVTLQTQIAEVKRELVMRERVYEKWIDGGTMKREVADKQVANLRGTLHLLLELQENTSTPLFGTDSEIMKLARLRNEEGMS